MKYTNQKQRIIIYFTCKKILQNRHAPVTYPNILNEFFATFKSGESPLESRGSQPVPELEEGPNGTKIYFILTSSVTEVVNVGLCDYTINAFKIVISL